MSDTRRQRHQTACVRRAALPCLLGAVFAAAPASAQLFDSETVIRDARIITMNGAVIERGAVVIKGNRITNVTTGEPKMGLLTKVIDASDRTITPGLIDAWSAMGVMDRAVSSGEVTARAWDGFDRYDREAYREALAQGVTTLSIGSPVTRGITGTSVIVQLVPQAGGAAGEALDVGSALTINLDSGASASDRISVYQGVREQFRTARKYREALELYEEELEEYLEKLEARRKKEEGDAKEAKKDEGDSPAPKEKPDESGDEEQKEEKKQRRKRGGGSSEGQTDSSWMTQLIAAADDDDDASASEGDADDPTQPRPRRRGRRGGRAAGDPPKPEEKKADGEKKEDELKKPEPPKPDRKSEVLLRAIDREIPVRVRAERSADIENALILSDEFNLDIIIEGGTEAYLLADRLAEADVPVILGPIARTELYQDNEYRRHDPAAVAALRAAGVRWTVGSGGMSRSSARFVGLNAQLAAGHAGGGVDWLSLVTDRAAEILGIDRRLGRIQRGARANLVIWSGAPGEPDARVEQVYVDGQLAYRAPTGAGGGS